MRSRSDSTASSPSTLSPNSIKCSSPQQFLQSWLKLSDRAYSPATNPGLGNTNIESSSCNKRQRETENKVSENKRVCLDNRVEENSDENSSAHCEASLGKELSKFDKDLHFSKDTNKENVDINLNSQSLKLSEISYTELKENSSCSKHIIQSDCKKVMTKQETNQSECKNAMTKQNGKKSNWLRDMGVKKKNFNKVSRKVNSPSHPRSPRLQEPSSPNTVSDLFAFYLIYHAGSSSRSDTRNLSGNFLLPMRSCKV